jgi:hypothetical protein
VSAQQPVPKKNLSRAIALAQAAEGLFSNRRAAWMHGFAVGLHLASRWPKTAASLRAQVEIQSAEATGRSPEQSEVELRSAAASFDLSEDTPRDKEG